MVLLCNVLHHRTDAYSQGEIWPACLLDFAVVCNKYDCCSAVNFHVTTWMKLFLREGHAFRNKADVACVLLNAAYLLDCPVEFNDISKRIIMDSAVPMIEILDWGAHGIIPLQAYSKDLNPSNTQFGSDGKSAQLHYRQQSLRRHVLKAIEQLENAQDCITMIGNFRCRHKCSLELLGHLKSILQASIRQSTINIRDVDRWGIFGLTEILSRHDFSTPIDKFVQQHPELRSCRSCSPEFDETFIPTLLSKVNSDSDANGLCLDCVKLYSRNNCWPDEMPDPMPCRVAHPPERLWG